MNCIIHALQHKRKQFTKIASGPRNCKLKCLCAADANSLGINEERSEFIIVLGKSDNHHKHEYSL